MSRYRPGQFPTARRGVSKVEYSTETVRPDPKPMTIMRRLMEAEMPPKPRPRPCPPYRELEEMRPVDYTQMCIDEMSIGPLVVAIGIKPHPTGETFTLVFDHFREHELYQNPESLSHRQRGRACWFICRVVESELEFNTRIEQTGKALELYVDRPHHVRYVPFTQYYGVYLISDIP